MHCRVIRKKMMHWNLFFSSTHSSSITLRFRVWISKCLHDNDIWIPFLFFFISSFFSCLILLHISFHWFDLKVIEHKPYDQKADVFSFGIALWELLTGEVSIFVSSSKLCSASSFYSFLVSNVNPLYILFFVTSCLTLTWPHYKQQLVWCRRFVFFPLCG